MPIANLESWMTGYLHAEYRSPINGELIPGTVTIELSSRLTRVGSSVTVPAGPIVRNRALDTGTDKSFNIRLPAQNDPAVEVTNFNYSVTVRLGNGTVESFSVTDIRTDESTDLRTLVPFEAYYLTPGSLNMDAFVRLDEAKNFVDAVGNIVEANVSVPGLDDKADIAYVDAAVAPKANTATVNTALGLKADTSAVTEALGLKANLSDLATKANTVDVASALALKADVSALATKANTSHTHTGYVTTAALTSGLATKADSTTVDAALALKASSAHTHVLADITNYQATPGSGGGLPSPTLPVGVAGNRVILFPSSNINNRRASDNPDTLILTPGYLPYPLSLASITLEVTNPADLTATLFYCTAAGEGVDMTWTPVTLGTFHAGSTGAKTMTGPFTIPAGIAWWGIKGLGVGYLSSAEQGIVGPVTNYTGSTANLGANNCALEISTTALTPFTRAEIYSPWYDVRLPWLQGVLA